MAIRFLSEIDAGALHFFNSNQVINVGGVFHFDTSSSSLTCSIAPAALIRNSGIIVVKNTGVNSLIVEPNGAETINGKSNLTLIEQESISIYSDSNNIFAFSEPITSSTITDSFTFNSSPVTLDITHAWPTKLYFDAISGDITVNMPSAVDIDGLEFWVKKIDSTLNQVIFEGNGAETIDGDPTATLLSENEALILTSDNSNFKVF